MSVTSSGLCGVFGRLESSINFALMSTFLEGTWKMM